MPSPFPGMNPYLETPAFWSQVHSRLIIEIADFINPKIRPKYRMELEQRVYQNSDDNDQNVALVGIPDNVVFKSTKKPTQPVVSNVAVLAPKTQAVEITIPQPEKVKEWYLKVIDVETKQVVTVIEILSPKNKKIGEGRDKYLKKRNKILSSLTNLIEIDLLRQGQIMPMNINEISSHYRIIISRSDYRPNADLYAFNLTQEIPSIPLPLKAEDDEPLIPLQELLHNIYDKGSYDLAINYQKMTLSELSEQDSIWVNNILKEQKLINN